jgi:hypothetical protein
LLHCLLPLPLLVLLLQQLLQQTPWLLTQQLQAAAQVLAGLLRTAAAAS